MKEFRVTYSVDGSGSKRFVTSRIVKAAGPMSARVEFDRQLKRAITNPRIIKVEEVEES